LASAARPPSSIRSSSLPHYRQARHGRPQPGLDRRLVPGRVYDRIEYRYNRQGERIEKKDQNSTVHAYEYDALGRVIHDRITAVGSGVDSAVRRISTTYEVRGQVATLTSYDSATVGSGNVVNQVTFEHDDAALLAKEYQEVGPGSKPFSFRMFLTVVRDGGLIPSFLSSPMIRV